MQVPLMGHIHCVRLLHGLGVVVIFAKRQKRFQQKKSYALYEQRTH